MKHLLPCWAHSLMLRLAQTRNCTLGASWGPLGAEGLNRRFMLLLLDSFLGPHIRALLGRLGALLGAWCVVLGRSWGPPGPSWSLEARQGERFKYIETSTGNQ
eukprot:4996828-Pyramimonas_sp.AAC.1